MKRQETKLRKQSSSSVTQGQSKWIGRAMVFSLAMLLANVATAMPAPGTYEKLQNEAEEVLRIRIINVGLEASDSIDPRRYTVQARVLAVFRSKSGLQRGNIIKFSSYVTPADTMKSCASSPPLVMKFWTGRIYLNGSSQVQQVSHAPGKKQTFELAAHSRSMISGPVSWAAFSRRSPTRSQIRVRLPSR